MTEEDGSALKIAQELLSGTTTCAVVAQDLSRLDRVSPGFEKLVHFLYHFVADEDVRGRDEEYARWQREELHRLIAEAMHLL
ncbi:hypothetical protein ACG0Z6_11725 [Roseateles sp. BYS180W]|uniref:Resolvase/invertase-type recombinase catalytic domain-containing protein n=1 Tax=Roseateles rivi TaxID=3299028 RepID=A0ABW7FX35_9BURK